MSETTEAPAGDGAVAGLELRPALEAVLMVVDEPATEEHLARILERPRRQIADALRALADEWFAMLRALARHTALPGAAGLTPSDVSLTGLSQADLDAFESQLGDLL